MEEHDEMEQPWDDEPAVGNPEAPDADRDAPEDPLAKAPALSGELASFLEEATDEIEAGSTPLPDEWKLLRAVFGGASRRLVEDAHTMHAMDPTRGRVVERLYEAMEYGRLSRGLHVIVGHTGGGKTALACNLVRAAALAGHPVVYVSLELDRPELAARLISLESAYRSDHGIQWNRLALRRPLAPGREQRARLEELKRDAIAHLQEPLSRLYVWAPDPGPDDLPPTVAQLRRVVLRAWEENGRRAPLIIFDYLQAPGMYARKPDEEKRLPLRERIAAITMQLRHISKAGEGMGEGWVGCPVVVLSTTARSNVRAGATGKQAKNRPDPLAGMDGRDPDLLRYASLEDLKALPKEAGEIEATAVTSWALSLARTAGGGPRKLTLRLAKNRKGPDGQWVPLLFDGATGKISDEPNRYALAKAKDAASKSDLDEEGGVEEQETTKETAEDAADGVQGGNGESTSAGRAGYSLLEQARPGRKP